MHADIAVGRIVAPPGTKFKPLRVGRSGDMRRGDLVAVLGAPLGG
jgi:S1-C subfamily serine protease